MNATTLPVLSRQTNLTSAIKQMAQHLGFDACRILPIGPAPHADFFVAWLAQKHSGEMTYLERHVEKRRAPHLLADEEQPAFHSLIVLAVNYHQFDLPPAVRDEPSRGLIAAYAWGDDYHELIRPRVYELDGFIRTQTGRTTPGKCLVDTGPVLERDWAHQAGIGFTGKNCCTIHPADGSWLLLATILVPEVLVYDPPPKPINPPALAVEAVIAGLPANQNYGSWTIPLHRVTKDGAANQDALGTCGRCTRCLVACPTDAFVGAYHLNPQRCIAYWTIEAKAPIPRPLRPLFANRIFGCDICQEVCPWNARLPGRTPPIPGLHAQHNRVAPPLLAGFDPAHPYWTEPDAFRTHFRNSPIERAQRHGMARNVCVALGNWGDPAAIAALSCALADPVALVRGHAAWALGEIWRRHQHPAAREWLVGSLICETDVWVREEIYTALSTNR